MGLSSCGSSRAPAVPDLAQLPLVPGSKIVAQTRDCDTGAAAFCAVEIVLVNGAYRTSADLLGREREQLVAQGWSREGADVGGEHAADSPGGKLRLTYATAQGDLTGIDLGWIKRPQPITLALSRVLFQRTSALSMMLEFSTS
jgi:hypothetical protein